MAMTQAMSMFVSGQPSSHPTEVYMGKDKHGREIYSNLFFAGAPKDFITFMNNVADYGPIEGVGATIRNKLAPATRTALQVIANRDWMGREIVRKETGMQAKGLQGLEHIALNTLPIPFSITNIVKMLEDTTHDYGFWDYMTVVGGAPPRHEIPGGAKPHHAGKRKFSIRGSTR
jgi:hypothetical protein